MVVTVRALLDDAGKPVDWTTEIWSPTHKRPGGGGNLLGGAALPDPPPGRRRTTCPRRMAAAAPATASRSTTSGEAHRASPRDRETPVRTSSLRGLGAMLNVFAIECCIDELAAARRTGPGRLSPVDPVRPARPRRHREGRRHGRMAGRCSRRPGRGRGIGFARYKNMAAYSAVVVEVEVDEEIRLHHVWCAADAGLVINPDGAINQLEGGIIQAASWALKEEVRLDTGVTSLDWESYPVLKFSEVPEIDVELINPPTTVPLGIGEVTGGPTVAAIGNAVSHALGARIRDLPMTRERVMAALLKE